MSDNSQRTFNLEGKELAYPTIFRDGSNSIGLYSVPTKVANEIIADSGFSCAEIMPGKTAMSLICVHYEDTDCGQYEEIAMAFFVKHTGKQKKFGIPYLSTWMDLIRGKVASFTWCLPVSTTISRDCGIQMWGFPKTLETIEYENQNGRTKSTWVVDGKPVLSFSVKSEGERDSAPISPPVYTNYEGKPHVSYLTQTYTNTGYHMGGGELELGDHPVADQLRRLGLPKKPLLASWNGHLKFEMSHPEPL